MTTYTTILKNQTPLDIALILTGSADNAYEIAKENEIDMSNMLNLRKEVQYEKKIYGVVDIVFNDFFSNGEHTCKGICGRC